MIGETISHYRILEKLGEGGMGVVYKGEDTKLRRIVALKFLAQGWGGDPELRTRLLLEAQAAAALSHPNVCTIYEIDDAHDFIAMEFISGKTVAEQLKQRPFPLEPALDIAAQAGRALKAATANGIVHRDIKPGNIMVTPEGQVKVMDFGLAKAAGRSRLTKSSVTVGTPAYMSPEQAQGQATDHRSDLWSLGVVLYEMIAGRIPENGFLYSDPEPLTAIRAGLPLELDRIVAKLLAKDPDRRYQDAADLIVDLEALRNRSAVVKKRSKLPWVAAVAAIAMALAWFLWLRADRWTDPLTNAKFTRFTDFEGNEMDAAISRDGRFVVFLSDRDGPFDAWIGQVGGGDFVNLTKGQFPELFHQQMRSVGFTPDGSHVWLRTSTTTLLIPTLGGSPRPYVDGIFPDWSPDGKQMIFMRPGKSDATWIADEVGRNPKILHQHQSAGHTHYLAWGAGAGYVYLAFGEPPSDIWRLSSSGSAVERVTSHGTHVAYPTMLDSRTLVYVGQAEDGTGYSLYSMDVNSRQPRRFNSGVDQYLSVHASADGRRLAASAASPTSNLWIAPIADRVVAETDVKRFDHPTVRALAPRFSGGWLFYLSSRGTGDGLWRVKDGVAGELWKGSDGAIVDPPAVSPDGKTICFAVRRGSANQLHIMSSDGMGIRTLAEGLDVSGSASWSPDGQSILVSGKDRRIYNVALAGGAPAPIAGLQGFSPVWSPNGQVFLYQEAPTGSGRFLKASTAAGTPVKMPIMYTRTGGDRARFLPDGQAAVVLLGAYRQQDFWLLHLATGKLRRLTNLRKGYNIVGFDITPDGKSIVFDRSRENADIVLIDVPTRH